MTPYYDDGQCVIYHGDCRDVLAQDLPADLVVADPPYSLSVDSDHAHKRGKGTRRLDFFKGDTDWSLMTSGVVERMSLVIAQPGVKAAYVWCGHRQFGPLVEMFERRQWATRPLVWRKLCPVPAPPGVGWDSAVELCVYAFTAGRKWTPPTGTKCPNFIEADSYRHGQPGKVDHPTQKPPRTASLLIDRSSDAGDTVLDPFMGSGTTLVAAKSLGRRGIGIEIEERYCEIAARRLAQGALDLGGAA